MEQIRMSQTAFQAALHLLNCAGKTLLPQERYVADRGADAFLVGRDELCRRGWVELDFDGSLLPAQPFIRMVYGLSHIVGAVRLEQKGCTQWYLRTPVELLFLERRADDVLLERRRGSTVMRWMRDEVLLVQDGCLTTQSEDKQLRTELSGSEAGGRSRAEELAKHLCLFFGTEGEHA